MISSPAPLLERPSLSELVRASFKVGCLGFGGPAGQIALMHRVFVDEKKWIDEAHYLHALNYCMLLPGPEAQQLATYVGWLLHGVRGGLIAGLLFVLPGAVIVFALSWLYAVAHQAPLVAAAFYGIKAAVLALVLEAVLRVGKRALKSRAAWIIALCSFAALFCAQAYFPIVILCAGLAGWAFIKPQGATTSAASARSSPAPKAPHAFLSAAFWLAAWLAPVAASLFILGPSHVITKIGQVFSLLAIVTFGGAYATLSYLQQEAVQTQSWLSAGQMIDGLGLAETTPGPLVLVNQFVGYLAGFQSKGGGLALAAAGAAMASWCTFAPSFAWIFAGAPYAERLRSNRAANAALAGITAGVLGIIVNLAIWFGAHVVFVEVTRTPLVAGFSIMRPDWTTLDWRALALALAAIVALFRLKLGVLPLVLLAALAGIGAECFL